MSKSNGQADERSIFDPDPDNLEKEWVGQPGLLKQWTDKLADARKEAAEQKASFKLVEAEVALEIRSDPEKHGLEKVTEAGVQTATIRHKRYQKAQQDGIDADHTVDVLQGTVNALQHRKTSLENLVQLWLAGYFSTPRIKGNPEAAERMDEATKRNIRKRASK